MEALKNEVTYGILTDNGKKPLVWFDSYDKAEKTAWKYARFLKTPCTIVKRVTEYSVAAVMGFYVDREESEGNEE